jgi:DNA/RNA-binding domain of Phe-tRNA-synthetase-like protein
VTLVHFGHSREIWTDYPELAPGVLAAEGIDADVSVQSRLGRFTSTAESRLAAHSEGELLEIQAWRRAFSRMGLKPTQYRCAAEALLRRFRKEHILPQIHPLIDLCNAVSMAFAIPVAVYDVSKVDGYLEVRYATGSEIFEAFSGEIENPEPHEVIFADAGRRAHARRWTNRQSGHSAARDETVLVLIVAEALHESADTDVQRLIATIAEEIDTVWATTPRSKLLTSSSARFEL